MEFYCKTLLILIIFLDISCNFEQSPAKTCTLVGCANSLNIQMTRDWEAGINYLIRLEYMTNSVECTSELAISIDQANETYSIKMGDEWITEGCLLFESNVEWPLNDDKVIASANASGNSVSAFPESVSYIFSENGATTSNGVITPEIGDKFFPNGEECDQEDFCRSANYLLQL